MSKLNNLPNFISILEQQFYLGKGSKTGSHNSKKKIKKILEYKKL